MDIEDVEVIAPNFKRRLSGVTSTIVQLLPLQANRIGIVSVGPDVLPRAVPRLPYSNFLKLWRRPSLHRRRVWHARRNLEMLAGVFLRDVLRMPLRLLFTSAAQREHTAWTRFLISRMDAVIATSARSAVFLQVPHTIIKHGIDLNSFRPDGPLPTGAIAEKLEGRKIVGCSGRIRHQKGTDLFVAAMIDLLPRHPEWSAIVTGRVTSEHRSFAAELEAAVAKAGLSGRILFTGEVDEVAPWFRRFDLYVAPPRNEGFGLTPLEAMASRTPVVATDAGAFAELIVQGETGHIVPTDDSGALAAAIEPYLIDDAMRERAAEAALHHVRANFPLKREADDIIAVYSRLFSLDDR